MRKTIKTEDIRTELNELHNLYEERRIAAMKAGDFKVADIMTVSMGTIRAVMARVDDLVK